MSSPTELVHDYLQRWADGKPRHDLVVGQLIAIERITYLCHVLLGPVRADFTRLVVDPTISLDEEANRAAARVTVDAVAETSVELPQRQSAQLWFNGPFECVTVGDEWRIRDYTVNSAPIVPLLADIRPSTQIGDLAEVTLAAISQKGNFLTFYLSITNKSPLPIRLVEGAIRRFGWLGKLDRPRSDRVLHPIPVGAEAGCILHYGPSRHPLGRLYVDVVVRAQETLRSEHLTLGVATTS